MLNEREMAGYKHTACPGSSDPFYIVTYYINGSILLGHTVDHLICTKDLCHLNYFATFVAIFLVLFSYMILKENLTTKLRFCNIIIDN